ncbi:MAG: hypothetical protein Q4G30_05600 [Actinomycetaceae bacterium]|nr:hypothetical protein [Actinomycetaceae bacterium]
MDDPKQLEGAKNHANTPNGIKTAKLTIVLTFKDRLKTWHYILFVFFLRTKQTNTSFHVIQTMRLKREPRSTKPSALFQRNSKKGDIAIYSSRQ